MKKNMATMQHLPVWPVPPLTLLYEIARILSPILTEEERRGSAWAAFQSELATFVESSGAKRLMAVLQAEVARKPTSFIGELQNQAYLYCPPTQQLADRNFVFSLPSKVPDMTLIHRMVYLSQHMDIKAGVPECPVQYGNVFGSFIRPLKGAYEPLHTPKSRHIIVFCKGQCYQVSVVSPSGKPLSPAQIDDALRSIRNRTPELGAASIGPLTWLNRGRQSEAWNALRRLNPEAVHSLETALFTVCLDAQTSEQNMSDFLVGPVNNRLHNQTQLICGNGQAFNIEHSGVDGTTWLRVVEDLQRQPNGDDVEVEETATVVPLQWTFNDAVHQAVAEGVKAHQARQDDLAIRSLSMSYPNLAAIKGFGVSPDALVQVAMQLAYLGATDLTTPPKISYESINLRHTYAGARTAAGMPMTFEVIALYQALREERADLATVQNALTAHTKRCNDYRQNGSPYRFLQALQWAATQPPLTEESLPFLHHPFLDALNDLGLSTSNCSSEAIRAFGFHPDGAQIGVGYRINDELTFCLTASEENRHLAEVFSQNVLTYLNRFSQMLSPPVQAS
jgi:carnitine O-acetyltransferase